MWDFAHHFPWYIVMFIQSVVSRPHTGLSASKKASFSLMEVDLTAVSQFSSVVQLCLTFATPWTAVLQAFLSITNSWSLLKRRSIELVMPSKHPLSSLSPPAFNLSQVDCSLPRILSPNLEFFLPAVGGGRSDVPNSLTQRKNDYLSRV